MTPDEFAEYSEAVNAVRRFHADVLAKFDPDYARAALVGVGLEAYEVEHGRLGVAAMLEARAERMRQTVEPKATARGSAS